MKRSVSIYIDPELHRAAIKRADNDFKCSFSAYVCQLIALDIRFQRDPVFAHQVEEAARRALALPLIPNP